MLRVFSTKFLELRMCLFDVVAGLSDFSNVSAAAEAPVAGHQTCSQQRWCACQLAARQVSSGPLTPPVANNSVQQWLLFPFWIMQSFWIMRANPCTTQA